MHRKSFTYESMNIQDENMNIQVMNSPIRTSLSVNSNSEHPTVSEAQLQGNVSNAIDVSPPKTTL